MTSLLQFHGTINERGVGLMFYLVRKIEKVVTEDFSYPSTEEVEAVDCTVCSTEHLIRTHPQLYRAFRKPAGRFGCWVIFRYLGEEHVPDLSTPIGVPTVPRGAYKLSQVENSENWHSS